MPDPLSLAQGEVAPVKIKKKVVARKNKALKLSRFDKDVARLVQQGVRTLDGLVARLGVDVHVAQGRLDQLIDKGFFVRDANGSLALGIVGYNKFAPIMKTDKADSQKPEAVFKTESKKNQTESSETKLDVVAVLDASRKAQEAVLQKPVVPFPRVDLSELLSRGAPVGISGSGKAMVVKEKDVCELCRAEFKVSVKNPQTGKFAHCVCGVAYHKDCYESLVEGSGRCARCGRKLASLLDQKSEESLKDIKDAFE